MVMNVKENTMKIRITLPPDSQNSASPKTLMARTLRILGSYVSERKDRCDHRTNGCIKMRIGAGWCQWIAYPYRICKAC
jgi:hypothetical protein